MILMSQDETFSIRQMVELTGLSEFTIRGWENRYSAFSPRRGDTGRREYSKSDIERALLLRELLNRGHKIGQVAKLNSQKLQSLFEQVTEDPQRAASEPRSQIAHQALELMALQKWNDLEVFIKKIPAESAKKLIHEFFLPALRQLSINIDAGFVSISQEHVFTSFLKEKIYSALSALKPRPKNRRSPTKGRFVLASPEGDFHETGLLLAHLYIRSYGLTSLYLGPHTPSKDLSETALRFDASHVLIVSTVSKKNGARQEPLHYVSDVQKKIGPRIQILVAGSQAPPAPGPHPSLLILRDFRSLEKFLEKIAADK